MYQVHNVHDALEAIEEMMHQMISDNSVLRENVEVAEEEAGDLADKLKDADGEIKELQRQIRAMES